MNAMFWHTNDLSSNTYNIFTSYKILTVGKNSMFCTRHLHIDNMLHQKINNMTNFPQNLIIDSSDYGHL